MSTVKGATEKKAVSRRREVLDAEEHLVKDRSALCLVLTSPLPDNTLLEIFDFYLDQDGRVDAWHTLVHVCKQWRCIVFASPRRLRLQLLCTPKRSMKMTLDIWPAFPIIVDFAVVGKRPRGIANVIAALKQHDRVCKINIRDISSSLLKKLAVKKPFPALTELKISARDEDAPVVPDSFMNVPTPSLRSLWLVRIPFPTFGRLLLSTCDLVDLGLWKIPRAGYISPKEMVTTLSTLTRLKKFVLGFQSSRSRDDRARRHPPLGTHVVLSALTMLYSKGDSEYLEDIASQIDAPLLESVKITFFNQLMLDTPLLRHFISRTETLQDPHRAKVVSYSFGIEITLFQQQGKFDREIFKLGISCKPSDWQLSALAQVCNSIVPSLRTLEYLSIHEDDHWKSQWQADMENTQWLDLLRPFTQVKYLVLSRRLVPLVAPALQDLAGERMPEVLPMLTNLVLEDPRPSTLYKEAIEKFIGARRLSGCIRETVPC